MNKLLLTPEDAAASLNVGRSRVYDLMRSGELKSVKLGRARRIPEESLRAYVATLVAKAGAL